MVIQEMKEIEQIVQLKFSLRMTWVDARLDFYNIKLDETMNVISLEELATADIMMMSNHPSFSKMHGWGDGTGHATASRARERRL